MNHNLIRFDDNKPCQCAFAYFLFSQEVFTFRATSFSEVKCYNPPLIPTGYSAFRDIIQLNLIYCPAAQDTAFNYMSQTHISLYKSHQLKQ